jgi:3-deoxy-D-manno-octulosonic-acid transferase
MYLIYIIFIYSYWAAIHLAALFNSKAKLWVSGRKNIFYELKKRVEELTTSDSKSEMVWVHCASLGEFEQGRPLIEKLKLKDKNVKIILTFFSPSGYEIRKNYSGADLVFYLPIDTASNARQFINIVQPKAAFFIKYEFWFNYLNELKQQKIPTYLLSGIFRQKHYFFKVYGAWFRKQLKCFSQFFVQDEQSKDLLNSIGYMNVMVAGDTRFDRVAEVCINARSLKLIESFGQNSKLVIAGSTWREDEKLIYDWMKNSGSAMADVKLIIAPHEIDEEHIDSIITQFSDLNVLRYSRANELNVKEAKVLVIDNIGMLSSVYQYGTIAFIGGGFGKGIHNILEAATFALPVIFGPKYEKFTEAKELIELGGAFSVGDVNELEKIMILLNDSNVLKTAAHISKYYVNSKVGATEKVLSFLDK